MVTSRVGGLAPRRQMAQPLPGATWQAQVLDTAAVSRELDKLWARFDGARHDAANAAVEAHGDPISVQMRATTFNLIAVARRKSDGARVEQAILHLGELYPSRATILIADADRDAASEPGLGVRVALIEQPPAKDHPAIRFECVTVEAHAGDDRHLASIASPLLVADLPDFLWWPGDAFIDSDLFRHLVDVTDRLIVDTATLQNPPAGLRHLTEMVAKSHGCPNISDFAWARAASWRQLVAQFFDPPPGQACLEVLDEVTITYGVEGDNVPGFSSALLLAGWLGSRLGWKPPGELVPTGDGGWRATLRTTGRGRLREVVLALRPTNDPVAARGLGSITLQSGGEAPGLFRIERIDALGLSTRSQIQGAPPVSRMVFTAEADDATLLAEELRIFGRDLVYEAALAFAATLAPTPAEVTA